MNGESFKVMVIKSKDGYNYASRKKCEHVIDLSTLKEYLENGTDFDVKIENLVRGGFIAKFNGTVDCFLPGAHAAANVIYDFESYLGKTVRVCVDNFDQGSNMYIVSHKKYIKKILPERIQDIEYGQKYSGVLTSDPTKFGIFVEFEIDPAYGPIYTGLIKFGNDNSLKNMKQGDEIEFYVSNVSLNGRGCKINLVTNLDDVPAENLEWQAKKNATVGKEFDYICIDGKLTVMDSNENEIYSLLVDPSSYSNGELTKYKKVIVNDVDVINKNVSLSFAE
jgi:ribosomal protein S1